MLGPVERQPIGTAGTTGYGRNGRNCGASSARGVRGRRRSPRPHQSLGWVPRARRLTVRVDARAVLPFLPYPVVPAVPSSCRCPPTAPTPQHTRRPRRGVAAVAFRSSSVRRVRRTRRAPSRAWMRRGTAGRQPNHSRGAVFCWRAESSTHFCAMTSPTSPSTRSNQACACLVSPTRRHSSPTRYVSTARSSAATPS